MSKTRDQINDFLKEIDVTDKTVLDVGAGRPRAWIFPRDTEGKLGTPKVTGEPKDYKTADIDPEWGCNFKVDLDNTAFFMPIVEYDYVFCMETLEHVYDPVNAIRKLSRLTKEKLFLSVPFIYPLHDTHDYLRYTFQWFERVLPMFGFKEVRIERRKSEDAHEFYRKEGMRMSKVTLKQGYADNIKDIGYCVEATK